MSDKFSLGKNNQYGEIDFSKLRSGITKDDLEITNDDVLCSIFDSVNSDNTGDSANKLDRNELNNFIQIIRQLCGKDNNLSSSEAKKYEINGEKLGKEKEALLKFLQKLSDISTKDKIKNVEQNANNNSEIITYEDGRTEEIFGDGSKIITVKNGNKTTKTKKDKSENIIEETIKDGENKTTYKEYNNGKLSKEIITDTDAGTVETISYDENGNPKSKEIKIGNSIVKEYKYENNSFVLKNSKDTENNTVTTYNGTKTTTVTEKDGVKITEIKENDVLISKKEESTLNDERQVTTTTYDDENNWTSETVVGGNLV